MNITRKSRIISIITACLLCAVSACSCSDSNVPISPESSDSGDSYSDIFSNPDNLQQSDQESSEVSEVSEVEISVAQEADENQTVFRVDSVLDVGVQTDDGMKYIYPLVTIKNSSDTDYDLSSLNNISILLDDGTEVHYDIRTQLYADDNIENYLPKVITVPAGGEVSGYAGGFIVPDGTDSFTVCFYPTQNEPRNKNTVIKCPISAENIETK